MTGNPFVGTARVGWMEFWSHLKSPRLIILIVLFALLVFGASYGLSQSPTMGFTNPAYLFGHPAIRNETDGTHYLVIVWVADVRGTPMAGILLSLYNASFEPYGGGTRTLIENLTTNSTGWASADLGTSFPSNTSFVLQSESGGAYLMGMTYVSFDQTLSNRTFTLGAISTSSTIGPTGSVTIFYTHVLTTTGYPATGANVYLNDTSEGHPDANGFFSTSLAPGPQTVRITYNGYEESYMVMGNTNAGPTYQNGADVVLLTVTTFFGLLLPIAAIAISFDAVARERAQGSLEILLAQRVRREGILLGKFLGAFASVALPVTVVLLAGVGILTAVSDKAPTGTFVVAVVASSLFLVAVYTLLMLLFSTVAKSVGTAVVFGVVLWLFFNLFFSFVTTFVLFSSGGSFFNPGTYGTLVVLQLFDPNTLFSMLVSLAIPSSGGYSGLVPIGYVSTATVVGAAVLWVAVLLVLTLFVFHKKAES